MLKYQKKKYQKDAIIISNSKRNGVYQFIESLLNNNHKEFFYVHEDTSLGLDVSCCAILRLSVAIRSIEHYDNCLSAKFMQLEDNFRAKLGWLVGNLYSRVGTEDWLDNPSLKTRFKEMVNNILDRKIIWLDNQQLKVLERKVEELELESDLEIIEIADKIKSEPKIKSKEKVVGAIKDILIRSKLVEEGDKLEKVLRQIASNPTISAYIKG
jgi:hypothetical protein